MEKMELVDGNQQQIVASACKDYVQDLAKRTGEQDSDATARWLTELAAENQAIHDRDCVKMPLSPADDLLINCQKCPGYTSSAGGSFGQIPSSK